MNPYHIEYEYSKIKQFTTFKDGIFLFSPSFNDDGDYHILAIIKDKDDEVIGVKT